MRRTISYASIGLIILMLSIANTAVAWSYGDDVAVNISTATSPYNIIDDPDTYVCSLGNSTNEFGIIYVLFDDDFYNGLGDDVTVYGYHIDSDTEYYDVMVGNYIDDDTPVEGYYIGNASDFDGEVSFDMNVGGTYNCLVLVQQVASAGTGMWPGAEIDAVKVLYD